jgi:hypothetical protein
VGLYREAIESPPIVGKAPVSLRIQNPRILQRHVEVRKALTGLNSYLDKANEKAPFFYRHLWEGGHGENEK